MENIDKLIAEAVAEESKAKPSRDTMVFIPLSEYVMLTQMETDLSRLVEVILDTATLGCNNDLRVDSDEVCAALKLLYPEQYNLTKTTLLEKEKE